MRKVYNNILTKQEAEILPSLGKYLDWNSLIIKKITDTLKKDFPTLKFSSPSYFKVESLSKGHPPHFDGCKKGDNNELVGNHMSWCRYSSSLLLSRPNSFKGGSFKFLTPPKKSIKRDAYLNLIFYSSGADNEPQKHCVTKHYDGDRYALLMFFAEEESDDPEAI